MPEQKDIFICHASEDKSEVVEPLLEACEEAGISYWYDNTEILWGDSITQKVNEGLKISRYVVVVLSEAFISKNWPQRELNAVMNIEASSGQARVLPLIVGKGDTRKKILDEYPILNDKYHLTWDKGITNIIPSLKNRLGISHIPSQKTSDNNFEIPLPKIKRKFTQRDKDLFIKSSFEKIKAYLTRGLSQLESQYSDIETVRKYSVNP